MAHTATYSYQHRALSPDFLLNYLTYFFSTGYLNHFAFPQADLVIKRLITLESHLLSHLDAFYAFNFQLKPIVWTLRKWYSHVRNPNKENRIISICSTDYAKLWAGFTLGTYCPFRPKSFKHCFWVFNPSYDFLCTETTESHYLSLTSTERWFSVSSVRELKFHSLSMCQSVLTCN